jgi:hypothetical protein
MYIKKKNKVRLFLLLLIVLLFVYWRGIRSITSNTNLECEYHVVYAVCKVKGQATDLPSVLDVLKAGIKF